MVLATRALTGPSLCATRERSSGPSLTGGSVVRSARSVIRPPPTPTRHHAHFPGSPVIGRVAPATTSQHRRAGEGLPSSRRHLPNVPRPIRREVHRGCASRLFTPSMAFAPNGRARLLLSPPEGGLLTTRQASRDAADRLVAPSNEASDAGLRPDPFPDRAASLLPGLLAATRTGLTPAGDDELMLDHDLHIRPPTLGAPAASS